jgi:hypothetical protein
MQPLQKEPITWRLVLNNINNRAKTTGPPGLFASHSTWNGSTHCNKLNPNKYGVFVNKASKEISQYEYCIEGGPHLKPLLVYSLEHRL